MKSTIPELQRLLSDHLNGFEIIEQNLSPLTGPGEHYGSIILAVNLKLQSTKNDKEDKTLNLVAKLLPANAMLRKVFDVYVTFKKEVLLYTVAIPAILELQKEYNIPAEKSYDNLFPLCAGARVSANENTDKVDDTAVLIFENLKTQGFYTEDRLKGYDAAAARLVLKDLARFHATPIALKLLKPEVFIKKIKPCLVKNRGLEQVPQIMEAFQSSVVEGADDCPELQPYLDRIHKVVDNCLHPPVDISPPAEAWMTLAHSDFWTSNSMILKNLNGKYIKSKILDFQLITYNSALNDVVFFLFTSVINADLDRHFDEFVQIYHDHFIDCLKEFNVDLDPFSWKNFQNELQHAAKKEIYHVLTMLKPICTERGAVKNTAENFVDSDWTRKDLLGPNHRRKLRDTIFSFAKRNWL